MTYNKKRDIFEQKEAFLSGIGVPEQSEFKPDDFQKAAIDSVVQGHDTLVVAPTGSGKTYIAVESISALLHFKQRCIYTTPLKALSNGKYNELKRRFEPNNSVGILTGDRKIDTSANVVVATTEIYRNELYNASSNYGLVVLDEVHYISDQQRGPVWEESIILTPKDSTILMLSASISNPREIVAWIESVRQKPCKLIIHSKRPVELKLGFLHPRWGAIPLNTEFGKISPEILAFYANTRLDGSGTRLRSFDRDSAPRSRHQHKRRRRR